MSFYLAACLLPSPWAPPTFASSDPCFGWECSSRWGSCCVHLVSGKKGFPGLPIALVGPVQVLQCGRAEKFSPDLQAPVSSNEHNVLRVRSDWAQQWNLVGREQESCPVPGVGLPRCAGQSVGHPCWMYGECAWRGACVYVLAYVLRE